MLNFNHHFLSALHITWAPTVSELMHIVPHTCWAMKFCELTLVINLPTSEEQVASEEYYYEEFDEV
jgi:hypothetical protein